MDEQNVVNDTQQAVVEPEKTGGTQSAAKNSGFRKMRLENERYKSEIESLKSTVSELEKLKDVQKRSDIYLEKLISDKMERDLADIQRSDPSVKALTDLGDDFLRLLENGIEASVAYFALKQSRESKKSKMPPTLKAMNTDVHGESAYFTSRELDRLSARDLENPKIFKKAMESLKKL